MEAPTTEAHYSNLSVLCSGRELLFRISPTSPLGSTTSWSWYTAVLGSAQKGQSRGDSYLLWDGRRSTKSRLRSARRQLLISAHSRTVTPPSDSACTQMPATACGRRFSLMFPMHSYHSLTNNNHIKLKHFCLGGSTPRGQDGRS